MLHYRKKGDSLLNANILLTFTSLVITAISVFEFLTHQNYRRAHFYKSSNVFDHKELSVTTYLVLFIERNPNQYIVIPKRLKQDHLGNIHCLREIVRHKK